MLLLGRRVEGLRRRKVRAVIKRHFALGELGDGMSATALSFIEASSSFALARVTYCRACADLRRVPVGVMLSTTSVVIGALSEHRRRTNAGQSGKRKRDWEIFLHKIKSFLVHRFIIVHVAFGSPDLLCHAQ